MRTENARLHTHAGHGSQNRTKPWSRLNSAFWRAAALTFSFEAALFQFVFWPIPYSESVLFADDVRARVHVYSLALIFKMWGKVHYRSRSFQQDLIDNLKNVALPGTGLPLSFFCTNYYLCLFFITIIYPLVSLVGAVNVARLHFFPPPIKPPVSRVNKKAPKTRGANGQNKVGVSFATKALPRSSPPSTGPQTPPSSSSFFGIILHLANPINLCAFLELVFNEYIEHLLHPNDWFSLWRLNCALMSFHSLVTRSKDYQMEDKWTFLVEGARLGVPVSPFLQVRY